MSKILEEIASNKISLEECLQRLLVIANKTNNKNLAQWCTFELNGYGGVDNLPEYRKFKSRYIYYSGINGRFQIKNNPIGAGYLSKETLDKIEDVNIFDNIIKVEEKKNIKEKLYRDVTFLAPEIYENTNDGIIGGVQCTSVLQLIPDVFYSQVYSHVKTRIINLLCSYESATLDIDKIDITNQQIQKIKNKNNEIYKTIVVDGEMYTFVPKENKLLWYIIIPIITAIIGGVLVYIISQSIGIV